jgi:hypothetical protein
MTTVELNVSRALRNAVDAAVRAPSVHNTQPWRFILRDGDLDVLADPQRQLAVLDPKARQMYLSIGCAMLNARVSLAGSKVPITTSYLPDPTRPKLVARVTATAVAPVDAELESLEPFIQRRQTNRRQFDADPVPRDVVDGLIAAARAEGATLVSIERADDRRALARLTQYADAAQILDPAYRAELRAWTGGDHRRADGVPARVVPHVDGTSGDEVPIRDFDTTGTGWLPAETKSTTEQCLLILGSAVDEPRDWIRAGEALERVWLEITRAGFVASVFTQVIEVAETRTGLRSALRLDMQPHVVLRVGHAPTTSSTMRRRIADVLLDSSSAATRWA